jgi:hypothetical protein
VADRFDAPARLAEGRSAVEHTQTYVGACHALGYQHPDLTAHAAQVFDWYDAEFGLDLHALDADAAALRTALNTIDEALWLQRAQIAAIESAWAGAGADSAMGFLNRQCDAAAQVVAWVRTAAEAYAELRDTLWQLVDGRAATAISIDDRRMAERSGWLAAAHTVMSGAGDRSVAEELVRQQVTPYVNNDIRCDWLTAMRSATASVAASYDAAIDALSSAHDVCFEIPGELGPPWQPIFNEPVGPSPAPATVLAPPLPPDASPAAPTVPASVPAPPSAPPAADTPDELASPLSDLAAPLGDAAGLSSGAGNLGSLGGLAGSIGGVVGKIVDGIGGLLGSLADGVTDPSGPDDPLSSADSADTDEAADDSTPDDTNDDSDEAPVDDAGPVAANEDARVEKPVENAQAADDSVGQPAAEQVAPPPAAPPPEQPAPEPDESTPCAIAENELPQAGQ